MTGMVPEYLGNKFISRGNISGWVTRSLQQLNIPLLKLNQGSNSFLTKLLKYGIIYHLKSSLANC